MEFVFGYLFFNLIFFPLYRNNNNNKRTNENNINKCIYLFSRPRKLCKFERQVKYLFSTTLSIFSLLMVHRFIVFNYFNFFFFIVVYLLILYLIAVIAMTVPRTARILIYLKSSFCPPFIKSIRTILQKICSHFHKMYKGGLSFVFV